jgi:hypothetical protein
VTTQSGTVRRFSGDGCVVVVGVDRSDGRSVVLQVARGVAEVLVAHYGVATQDGMDMRAILGRRVLYEESEAGLVVRLEVVEQDAVPSTAPAGRWTARRGEPFDIEASDLMPEDREAAERMAVGEEMLVGGRMKHGRATRSRD